MVSSEGNDEARPDSPMNFPLSSIYPTGNAPRTDDVISSSCPRRLQPGPTYNPNILVSTEGSFTCSCAGVAAHEAEEVSDVYKQGVVGSGQ